MSTEGTSRRTFALLAVWWGLFLVSYGIFLVRTPAHRQEVVRAITQLSAGQADGRILIVPLALVTFAFWAACKLVRFSPVAVVPLGMIGIILSVLGPQLEHGRKENLTLRCRIALGHWDETLGRRLNDASPLPQGTRTTDLFCDLLLVGLQPTESVAAWCCPGKDDSTERATGYIFVGGGLPTAKAVETKALLLFCAAGCHPLDQKQHAVFAGHWPEIRQCSATETVTILQHAIEQGESGAVPYSTDAVELMKREVAARKDALGD